MKEKEDETHACDRDRHTSIILLPYTAQHCLD